MLATIRDFLKFQGFKASCFTLAEAAIQHLVHRPTDLLDASPVDMIITDISMPGLDGFEFLTQVREILPDIPCLMLSAHASPEYEIRAKSVGAHHFLPKPFQLLDLRRAIRDSLNK